MIALFVLLGILMLVTVYLIWNNSPDKSSHQGSTKPKKLPKGK